MLEEITRNLVFEEIQEDLIQSPDSRELADYEEYCRRELPRVFSASLEEVVNTNTQPLEEQLRSQLIDLIRNAQDRVYSSYRSSSSTIIEATRKEGQNSSPQMTTSLAFSQDILTSPPTSPQTIENLEDQNRARLPAFLQPPPPQNHLQSG
jgi:chromatin segregation and condensation protein Rec8/ScpA/Scc1 (kleisin family)